MPDFARGGCTMTDRVAEKMSQASATRQRTSSQRDGRGDRVAEKMSQSSSAATMSLPKKGERYHCQTCGMEIRVTADCHCHEPDHVELPCFGQDLARV